MASPSAPRGKSSRNERNFLGYLVLPFQLLGRFTLLIAQWALVPLALLMVEFFGGHRRRPQKKAAALPPQWSTHGGMQLLAGFGLIALVFALAWRPTQEEVYVAGDVQLSRPLPKPSANRRDKDPFSRMPALPKRRDGDLPADRREAQHDERDQQGGQEQDSDERASDQERDTQRRRPVCSQPGTDAWHEHFAWADFNEVVKDTLNADAQIGRAALQLAIDEFGIPEAYLHAATAAEAKQKFHERGFRIRRGRYGVDYAEMVRRARSELFCIATAIHAVAERGAPGDARATAGVFASFVQSLKYPMHEAALRAMRDGTPFPEVIPEHAKLSNHTTVMTAGFRVPLETLQKHEGDCDSKSTLLAGLLAAVNGPSVVLLTGPPNGSDGHQFPGIEVPPRSGDKIVNFEGHTYVLVEVAGHQWGRPLGQPQSKYVGYLSGGLMEVEKVN